MSQVADLYETMGSGWCDSGVLLSNPVADAATTRVMLKKAHARGVQVLVEYDMANDPRGGDYVNAVSEPQAYLDRDGQRMPIADNWQELFDWVARECGAD